MHQCLLLLIFFSVRKNRSSFVVSPAGFLFRYFGAGMSDSILLLLLPCIPPADLSLTIFKYYYYDGYHHHHDRHQTRIPNGWAQHNNMITLISDSR